MTNYQPAEGSTKIIPSVTFVLLKRFTAVSRSVRFLTPVVRPAKFGTHSENQCRNSITTMNCMALIVNIIF